MGLKQIDHGSNEYKLMVNLRYEVMRKPLGLSFDEEELTKEKSDILIGCFEDDKLEVEALKRNTLITYTAAEL